MCDIVWLSHYIHAFPSEWTHTHFHIHKLSHTRTHTYTHPCDRFSVFSHPSQCLLNMMTFMQSLSSMLRVHHGSSGRWRPQTLNTIIRTRALQVLFKTVYQYIIHSVQDCCNLGKNTHYNENLFVVFWRIVRILWWNSMRLVALWITSLYLLVTWPYNLRLLHSSLLPWGVDWV